MSNSKQRAKRLLKHYMQMAVRASGLQWDSDNDAEVDEIVDCLISAAVAEAREEAAEQYADHMDNIERAREQMRGLRRSMGATVQEPTP